MSLPPGERGKLSVIAVGPAPTDPNDSSVSVIVRNNTTAPVYNVSASGTARVHGSLVGSGDSQGFAPAEVKPGEWAFGYVYFSNAKLAGATFDITATADTDPSPFGQDLDLKVAEVNKTQGEFGDSVVGIVSNDTGKKISNPIQVKLLCFNGATPQTATFDFTKGDNDLVPQATASFSVNVPDGACSTYALGASGSEAS